MQIDELKLRLDKLEHHDTEIEMSKMKGKNKGKRSDEFYHVNTVTPRYNELYVWADQAFVIGKFVNTITVYSV